MVRVKPAAPIAAEAGDSKVTVGAG